MILGAALLVLVALALFVGGIATGTTALYWACVVVSAVAAVLLVLARRQLGRPAARDTARDGAPSPAGDRAAPPVQRTGPPPFPPPPARRDVPEAAPSEAQPDAETGTTQQGDGVAGGAPQMHSGTTSVTDGTAAQQPAGRTVGEEGEDPAIEEVEVTDLLLVMDLHDEVVVVDEHPRYHLRDCAWLRGRDAIPLPLDEARTDGFTPCSRCEPDRRLAAAERERRAGRGSS